MLFSQKNVALNMTTNKGPEVLFLNKAPRMISCGEFNALCVTARMELLIVQLHLLATKNHQFLDPFILEQDELKDIQMNKDLFPKEHHYDLPVVFHKNRLALLIQKYSSGELSEFAKKMESRIEAGIVLRTTRARSFRKSISGSLIRKQ